MELMKKANKKNFVIVQIESAEAVEIIDSIAAVPGLDGIVLGPNDFTQHIGFFGQYDHPIMDEAIKKMEDSAKKYGKWSGVITGNEKLLRRCRAAGMRFFSVGSELSMLAAGAKATIKLIEDLVKQEEAAS